MALLNGLLGEYKCSVTVVVVVSCSSGSSCYYLSMINGILGKMIRVMSSSSSS